MDFNSLERCGELSKKIKDKDKIVMIDHHQVPENYAVINFSYPKISSTCEIVYNIIENSGKLNLINKEIATCIYLGMMTDTGCFSIMVLTAKHLKLHLILKKDIKQSDIYNKIYNENNISKLKLL